ncbi:Opi8p [Saccharomyces cerevisiae EC1118]|uniref:Opi8p n=3 Tax=Saccharomyces TaxID=4930 RepID=C8ZCJ9_YEAS8|nr:hypothetical protein AWRI1631_112580 [Saccharomyces cerevisiae AWRI1631]CAY81115.1 Opi8p [Saccharomyces cerevisiae EC1118]
MFFQPLNALNLCASLSSFSSSTLTSFAFISGTLSSFALCFNSMPFSSATLLISSSTLSLSTSMASEFTPISSYTLTLVSKSSNCCSNLSIIMVICWRFIFCNALSMPLQTCPIDADTCLIVTAVCTLDATESTRDANFNSCNLSFFFLIALDAYIRDISSFSLRARLSLLVSCFSSFEALLACFCNCFDVNFSWKRVFSKPAAELRDISQCDI